jgi:hypothetical protein
MESVEQLLEVLEAALNFVAAVATLWGAILLLRVDRRLKDANKTRDASENRRDRT